MPKKIPTHREKYAKEMAGVPKNAEERMPKKRKRWQNIMRKGCLRNGKGSKKYREKDA